jgi:hypothetical protein
MRRNTRKQRMVIETAAQAIDLLGGNSKVAEWLDTEPHTVSGWRKRGISRNQAMHFFAELVERRGYSLSPKVFGLPDWNMVLMPDKRGRKVKRVA